jgi:hypothetical protein
MAGSLLNGLKESLVTFRAADRDHALGKHHSVYRIESFGHLLLVSDPVIPTIGIEDDLFAPLNGVSIQPDVVETAQLEILNAFTTIGWIDKGVGHTLWQVLGQVPNIQVEDPVCHTLLSFVLRILVSVRFGGPKLPVALLEVAPDIQISAASRQPICGNSPTWAAACLRDQLGGLGEIR